MDPQESGTTSHRVTFDISVKDSEGFKAALQFRGIVLVFLLRIPVKSHALIRFDRAH